MFKTNADGRGSGLMVKVAGSMRLQSCTWSFEKHSRHASVYAQNSKEGAAAWPSPWWVLSHFLS